MDKDNKNKCKVIGYKNKNFIRIHNMPDGTVKTECMSSVHEYIVKDLQKIYDNLMLRKAVLWDNIDVRLPTIDIDRGRYEGFCEAMDIIENNIDKEI